MSYKTCQEAGRSCPNDSSADTKIVEELPQMRRETVHLARQAVSEVRRAHVLVNTRAEGNAPLTVRALSEMPLQWTPLKHRG
jgi:hypothetical protein